MTRFGKRSEGYHLMKFIVLTIFPEMFAPLQESILKRAQEANLIQVKLVNFRDYALSKIECR
jgi:tRNA (guanine37-N1)-methyltransferase